MLIVGQKMGGQDGADPCGGLLRHFFGDGANLFAEIVVDQIDTLAVFLLHDKDLGVKGVLLAHEIAAFDGARRLLALLLGQFGDGQTLNGADGELELGIVADIMSAMEVVSKMGCVKIFKIYFPITTDVFGGDTVPAAKAHGDVGRFIAEAVEGALVGGDIGEILVLQHLIHHVAQLVGKHGEMLPPDQIQCRGMVEVGEIVVLLGDLRVAEKGLDLIAQRGKDYQLYPGAFELE